jgi:hypothetical protein
LKTQNFTQNALTGSAHRPGEKGEKNKKNISPVFSQKKTFFRESPGFLAALFMSTKPAAQKNPRPISAD